MLARTPSPSLRSMGWAVAACVALAGCKPALFHALNSSADDQGVVVTESLPFDPVNHLSLDVYRPAGEATRPTLVFFYGGSWKSGKREWYRWAGEALAKQGFVVAVPDYRQWPQVREQGFMKDAARAVAYVHTHAAEWHGDPNHFFLMGHSAGGYIAAMLAVDARWLEAEGMKPAQLSALVGLAGPYDFAPIKDPDNVQIFGASAEEQRLAMPVSHVDGAAPPMLLLQGNHDDVVDPRNATAMAAAMEAKGREAHVTMYPDLGHVSLLLNLREKQSKVRDDAVAFLRAH